MIMITMTEPRAWDDDLQRVLNTHPVPARYTNAPWPHPPVRARLVWERDGEQWLDTVAVAWTRELVLVDVVDPRVQVHGQWLAVEDVERR